MSMIRAFVAIPLDEPVRSGLASWQAELRACLDGFRWVEPGNLHLTLKFLGDTPEGRLDAVRQALAGVAGRYRPFRVEVCGAGAFPDARAPRILWAGVADSDDLARLYDAVEVALAGLGWARDPRGFRPHLTLARAREPRRRDVADRLAPVGRRRWGEMVVTAFTLFQSTLTPDGPIYTPLQEFALSR